MTNKYAKFLHHPSAAGIFLGLAAIIAIVVANSPLQGLYNLLLDVPVTVQIGTFAIDKPLLLWVNDGLMAVFFFMVGLELKREFIEGALKDRNQLLLPAVGAIGGMAVPALVYVAFNSGDPVALKGWAIPAATDIAFALGVLALLGTRVPIILKVFLVSLAILDDIGAIMIIALFYTEQITSLALITAAGCVIVLWIMNRSGVEGVGYYLVVGLVMWAAVLKSGVHATLAGVVLALFIPMRSEENPEYSPLKTLEHDIHGAVNLMILPLFAFCNSGLNFSGMGLDALLHPVPVGIALGLFLGKQLGVFGFCFVAVKLGFAKLPVGMNWGSLYGVSLLCGIGFTMSLFIGSLAFEETGVDMMFDERLGILVGSLFSGVLGYLVLNRCVPKPQSSLDKGGQ